MTRGVKQEGSFPFYVEDADASIAEESPSSKSIATPTSLSSKQLCTLYASLSSSLETKSIASDSTKLGDVEKHLSIDKRLIKEIKTDDTHAIGQSCQFDRQASGNLRDQTRMLSAEKDSRTFFNLLSKWALKCSNINGQVDFQEIGRLCPTSFLNCGLSSTSTLINCISVGLPTPVVVLAKRAVKRPRATQTSRQPTLFGAGDAEKQEAATVRLRDRVLVKLKGALEADKKFVLACTSRMSNQSRVAYHKAFCKAPKQYQDERGGLGCGFRPLWQVVVDPRVKIGFPRSCRLLFSVTNLAKAGSVRIQTGSDGVVYIQAKDVGQSFDKKKFQNTSNTKGDDLETNQMHSQKYKMLYSRVVEEQSDCNSSDSSEAEAESRLVKIQNPTRDHQVVISPFTMGSWEQLRNAMELNDDSNPFVPSTDENSDNSLRSKGHLSEYSEDDDAL